jgi:hypothetical protein
MGALIRTILFVIVLLFASGWLNGDRLRYVGERTQIPVWERMAVVVDKAQDQKSRVFGGAKDAARERFNTFRIGVTEPTGSDESSGN